MTGSVGERPRREMEEETFLLRLQTELDSLPVVDVAVALDYALNDRELLSELVLRYLEVTGERVQEMQQACEDGALDQVRRTAHAMKGGSYYVGAMRMIALVQALQLQEDCVTAGQLIRWVAEEYASLQRQYRELKIIA